MIILDRHTYIILYNKSTILTSPGDEGQKRDKQGVRMCQYDTRHVAPTAWAKA